MLGNDNNSKKTIVYLKLSLYKLIVIPVALVATGFLFSCGNSKDEIEKVSNINNKSGEKMDSVTMTMYERGDAIAVLRAKKIVRSQYPPQTRFPEGLEVIHYDSLNQVEARLIADRGIYLDANKKFEVFDNVILKNYVDDQTLYTDYLLWDQSKGDSSVQTKELVRIFDGQDMHEAKDGVITDEKLSWYMFTGYSNIIEFNKDSLQLAN